MPRFYVDLQDEEDIHEDDVGSELESLEQARIEAVSLIYQVSKDKLLGGEYRELIATVRDEAGKSLYRATLLFKGEWLSNTSGITVLPKMR